MNHRRRAFTLLELLVALTMSATIAGTLAASLFIAHRARNSATSAVDMARRAGAIESYLARDLACALQPTGILAATFTGQPDSLSFYCTGTESRADVQSDVRLVEYTVAADPIEPTRTSLIRRVNTNLLAPVEETPDDERICADVSELAFRYFDGTSWVDSWDSTQYNNALPLAVEISLTLLPREGEGDPLHLMRTVRPSCASLELLEEGSGGTE